jgi:hypothetical protein
MSGGSSKLPVKLNNCGSDVKSGTTNISKETPSEQLPTEPEVKIIKARSSSLTIAISGSTACDER